MMIQALSIAIRPRVAQQEITRPDLGEEPGKRISVSRGMLVAGSAAYRAVMAENEKGSPKGKGEGVGVGLAIGLCAGAAIGIVTEQLAMWMAIGLALGVALGAAADAHRGKGE